METDLFTCRKYAEQKSLEMEDHFEGERKELTVKLESLTSIGMQPTAYLACVLTSGSGFGLETEIPTIFKSRSAVYRRSWTVMLENFEFFIK